MLIAFTEGQYFFNSFGIENNSVYFFAIVVGSAKHQMQEPDTEWTQNEDSSASSMRSSSRAKTSRGLRKHKTGILSSSSANQIE